MVGANDRTLKFYLNESSGGTIIFTLKTASADNPFDGASIAYNPAPTFADVDGDSGLDLVVGGEDGILKFYLNESTNSSIVFTDKTETKNPFSDFDVGFNSSPAFVDLDGDSDLDLAVGRVQEP